MSNVVFVRLDLDLNLNFCRVCRINVLVEASLS